jgi:hypothetical protein
MAVSNFGTGGGGFQISPGVNVSEIDLTTVVPTTSTTEGVIGGVFRWGPIGKYLLIDSENSLAARYGKPKGDLNPETWFTAANFLSYGNKLYVSRAGGANVHNAVANSGAYTASNVDILNPDDAEAILGGASFGSNVHFVAKHAGAIGNSLRVSVCLNASQYSSNVAFANTTVPGALSIAVGATTGTFTIGNSSSNGSNLATSTASSLTAGDFLLVGNSTIGTQYLKIKTIGAVTPNTANVFTVALTFDTNYRLGTELTINGATANVERYWEGFNQVDSAPGQSDYTASKNANTAATDELHVIVIDEDGEFTGNPGTVVEVFQGLSRATDSRKSNFYTTNYYKSIINDFSSYIFAGADFAGATSATATNIAAAAGATPPSFSFVGGSDTEDESSVAIQKILTSYDLFSDKDTLDISLVLTGKSRGGVNNEQVANYLIDNIASVRKDCVVFISPAYSDVVGTAATSVAQNIIDMRNSVRSTSYAVMDSGYKYQYDKYNDIYRYIPLNGDTAGLCVRTDNDFDPWFSPAGYNRGQIKNVIKLAYNPSRADRDVLYKAGVNPVVTFPGQGTVLFGDKTLLAKSGAFDRINVRRLFIVLEKAISQASKFSLFEFNDEFTRAQFVNLVEPFLRDVQGRRGIFDFRVVCDDTNNSPEVIDSQRFVGDIYIKPAKSINFIQLNFVAVRSGVEFSEIAGQF